MSNRKPRLLLVSIVVLAGIVGMAGLAIGRLSVPGLGQARPPQLAAATALLDQTRPLPAFRLTDDRGQPFTKQALKGRWTLLFFGYTHCPDICPTTLATLDRTVHIIADHGKRADTQVVFVSVDPERDTPGRLHDFVDYFNPRFTGVTGSPEAIDALTTFLGIAHQRQPGPRQQGGAESKGYLISHGASVLLIDPRGRLAAHFGPPQHADQIASDLHKLRGYYQENGQPSQHDPKG